MQFGTIAHQQSELRRRITAAYREDETHCVQRLLAEAQMTPQEVTAAQDLARRLVTAVRAQRTGSTGVDALMQEFSLSSQEGVALMCLAEALLRIPDKATRDALIRDKVAARDRKSVV